MGGPPGYRFVHNLLNKPLTSILNCKILKTKEIICKIFKTLESWFSWRETLFSVLTVLRYEMDRNLLSGYTCPSAPTINSNCEENTMRLQRLVSTTLLGFLFA